MRVAIFGGSFNPPHVAHQMAALYVLETAPVDELWLVPAVRHAFGKTLAAFADRLAMCERAAAALGARVRVSAIERELGEESRTLKTIRRLQQDHPGTSFSLVIGADLLAEVPSWFGGAELQRTVPFIVVGRAGFSAAAPDQTGTLKGFPDPPATTPLGKAQLRPRVELPAVSSRQVRAALAAGQDVSGLVPRAVLDYISAHNLYKAGEEFA